MHPSHSGRSQNMQHHLHQPTILQRPPPVGISVGPQMLPQQHHHMPNVPHPGGMPSYVPPYLRDRNRVGQRLNSQMHHGPMQSKYRSNISRNMGISNSPLLNQIDGPHQHQPHNVQSYHQSQGLLQKSSNKSTDYTKQKGMQKTPQVISSQQVILPPPSTSSHQKIAQPQIGPINSQHNMSSQQGKSGDSLKTIGTKHSQSNPCKSSQSSQGNPIRNAHLQTATHLQSANKPFQPHFKSIPSNKFHQATFNRPSNSQSSRTSPPQKIQGKNVTGSSTSCSIITPSIPDNASVPNSKCNMIGMQTSSPAVANSSTALADPCTVAHNSVSNTTSNAQAVVPAINAIVTTPQGQKLLHSSQNTTESQTSCDNQINTQTSHQNLNAHVSSNQQELQADMGRGNSQNSSMNEGLANTKEKTPMCLVNELARYNKIQHQYRLTSEQGPAHCKIFTVTLKLGDEDYTADGLSIKKAQHAAASEAISKTRYMHPPIKTSRMKNGKVGIGNITPTVELNALLMKLGEPALYISNTPEPPAIQILGSTVPQSQNGYSLSVPNQNFMPDNHFSNFNRPHSSGMFPTPRLQRFPGRPYQRGFVKFNPRCITPINGMKELAQITLVVGKHKFVGFGISPQLAKHDAATRALEVLKPLVSSKASPKVPSSGDEDPNAELKSPISLVHETALKRDLQVSFEVKSERGEPHMKTFVTLCKVGDLVTDGEGNGKKISKKRAAEKMLEELKKLPPLSPSKLIPKNVNLKTLKKKPPIVKKKAKNLIKENSNPEVPEEINPISKLIQIQQALKAREPMYTLVEEIGAPRRREFVIEVSANGKSARGIGSNKKMAKKVAARNLLMLLGYENGSADNENNAQVINGYQGGSSGRQIVPGLLLMQQTSKNSLMKSPESVRQLQSQEISSSMAPKNECNASSAKNLPSNISREGVRPKDQLLYLAQLLEFQAVFSDYPKGNHGEYLTIVTLSTDPPQICHGAGSDTDQSQDKASITALQMLSELGLDNVKPKKSMEEKNEQIMIENSKE